MEDRIKGNMNFVEMLYEMSEGNPGALDVLGQLVAHKTQNWAGGLGLILNLDTHRIYGSDIWVLYKDICGEDIDLVCTVLRTFQFGTFSREEIAEVLKENASGKGGRKLVSKDIPVDKSVYDATTDTIGNHEKFEEYLKKQREFFESQQSTFGG